MTYYNGIMLGNSDQRRKWVRLALKKKTNATKVTEIRETRPGVYSGKCFATIGRYKFEVLGVFEVTAAECGMDESAFPIHGWNTPAPQ